MASTDRQQRRRRIMDKGTDRLALITGQIKNLEESVTPKASDNPTPNPISTHHSHTESLPPIMVSQDFINSINAGLHEKSKSAKMVKMRTITPTTDIVEPVSTNIVEEEKAPNTITSTEDNIISNTIDDNNDNTNTNTNTNTTNITNTDTNASSNTRTNAPVTTSSNNLTAFTSKRINQSIIYSERARAICSIIIGLLVIVKNGESFITSRPFYLILLTDVTIVVARIFACFGDEGEDKRTAAAGGGGENVDDAFKLLERGLLLYQAIRAIFIDSSIYLVVVICGLSVTYNV
ncbi:hypothetical protein M5689_006842 [Euphorbia peplus]|nr:hypothetical protein M5689_006842 [Euphorbia peplus]